MFADFIITSAADDGTSTALPFRIVGLLPNPAGTDAGNEVVRVRNVSASDDSLDGWSIVDRAGNTRDLAGQVAAGQDLAITLSGAAILNNSGGGDGVRLLSPDGLEADEVSYTPSQVSSGGGD